MAQKTVKVDYLSLAAKGADVVYEKVIALGCKHKSGIKSYAEMSEKKAVSCASSASIAYQLASILPVGKGVNHTKAVGGSDSHIISIKTSIESAMLGDWNLPAEKVEMKWIGKRYSDLPAKYRKKGIMYIQDSNVCICAGNGAIYSCNNAKSQLDGKGRYIKDMVTGGYPFTSPILVVVAPKTATIEATAKEDQHEMDTLKKGDQGQQVMVLQKLLGGLDIDGVFGEKTADAVCAYQVDHTLEVDGIVGPMTWGKLLA